MHKIHPLLLLGLSTALAFGQQSLLSDLDWNARTIAIGLDNFESVPLFGQDNDTDFLSVSILRLIAQGKPKSKLKYEIHAVQSFTYFNLRAGAGSPGIELSANGVRYQAIDAATDWIEEEHFTANLLIDRFNLKLELPSSDVTLGRQAITFGKAYFWNPLDIFSPFDPRQFDRDYKAGVDALRVDHPLGDFSGLNIVGALGREIEASGRFVGGKSTWHHSFYGSVILGRAFTNWKGWDLAVQGGKVYGGYQIGGATTGEFGPLAFRFETAYLFVYDSPPLSFGLPGELVEDNFQAVVGIGHRFESSLQLEAEYFYNGAGEVDQFETALIRQSTGGSLNLSRQLAGFFSSYEILPILVGQMAAMVSLSDGSLQVQPSLRLSVSDETDLLIGLVINMGDRPNGVTPVSPGLRSEFGSQPNFIYAELKVYF